MTTIELLQAAGKGFLERKKLGIRCFHARRQATRQERRYTDPYSQRMLRTLQAIGRGAIARHSVARKMTNQLVPASTSSARRRRRLVPIGYRPPRTQEERHTRLQNLVHRMFVWRVRQVQRWWRSVLHQRRVERHRLVVARLSVFNAMAVLIQRWWRSQLAQTRFVPPTANELRHASMAIVNVEDLRQQRLGNRAQLLERWNAIVSRDTRVPSDLAGKIRPRKQLPRRTILNPIPVSGRYVSNLSAAHRISRSEWNDSSAVGVKSWYSDPK